MEDLIERIKELEGQNAFLNKVLDVSFILNIILGTGVVLLWTL